MSVIEPGATLGVFGGGQLGRMFAQAAVRMGYRVHVLAPEPDPPAAAVSAKHFQAAYDDADAVRAFAKSIAAVTCEFENVPIGALEVASEIVPTRPGPTVLAVAQDRARERAFLDQYNLPTAVHHVVNTEADLQEAIKVVGLDGVLKTQRFGYDGKGQARVQQGEKITAAWRSIGAKPAIFEAWVNLACELSVIVARGVDGASATYGPFENVHTNHILDVTVCPAQVAEPIRARAIEVAHAVADALQLEGLVCVEMFVTPAGEILINELAPRPHNSGHLTIEAHVTSQYEQQVRTLCSLPLGATTLRQPAAMVNLLGDLWANGAPNFAAAMAHEDAHLHLYGKHEARAGRKMGHITALATDVDTARQKALAARSAL